jgi:hypothetical protein
MMAVPVRSASAAELSFGTPRVLFRTSAHSNTSGRQYDVAPDGQRLLLCEPVLRETASPIVIVVPGTRVTP